MMNIDETRLWFSATTYVDAPPEPLNAGKSFKLPHQIFAGESVASLGPLFNKEEGIWALDKKNTARIRYVTQSNHSYLDVPCGSACPENLRAFIGALKFDDKEIQDKLRLPGFGQIISIDKLMRIMLSNKEIVEAPVSQKIRIKYSDSAEERKLPAGFLRPGDYIVSKNAMVIGLRIVVPVMDFSGSPVKKCCPSVIY